MFVGGGYVKIDVIFRGGYLNIDVWWQRGGQKCWKIDDVFYEWPLIKNYISIYKDSKISLKCKLENQVLFSQKNLIRI